MSIDVICMMSQHRQRGRSGTEALQQGVLFGAMCFSNENAAAGA